MTPQLTTGKINTPVISYCGVLLKDSEVKPFETLCHFDMMCCEERITDFPLLQAAAQMLYEHLQVENYMEEDQVVV